MAAPREILLTSEASGQLWNTCAWDPLSGTAIITYKGSSAGPRTLCILGNDYLINAVNNKPLIHIWALQRKDQMQQRIVCPGRVSALATSPDGAYCVAAIAEKIHVWQVNTGNLLAVLTRHYQPVTCLRFTDDGSHFVSGGDDNLVLVWSMSSVLGEQQTQRSSSATGVEPRYTWSTHSLPITDIHIGSGGVRCRVATASLDHTCKLWEMATGKQLCSFIFDTSITSVTMDPGEYRMLAGASSGIIYQVNLTEKEKLRLVWRVYDSGGAIQTANKPGNWRFRAKTAGFSEAGGPLAQPTRAELHISEQGEESRVLGGHNKPVTCLAVSMDGTMLASGSQDCNVKVWDILSLQCIKTLLHKGPLTNVLMVPMPPNITNPDARPSLPIAQFKRSLYSHQSEAQYEGEQYNYGTVNVRLGKRSHENTEEATQTTSRKCVSHLQNQDPTERAEEQVKLALHDNVSQLKDANKALYYFAIKEIIASK